MFEKVVDIASKLLSADNVGSTKEDMITATARAATGISVQNTGAAAIHMYIGAAKTEKIITVAPNQNLTVAHPIPKGTLISVNTDSATLNTGWIIAALLA